MRWLSDEEEVVRVAVAESFRLDCTPELYDLVPELVVHWFYNGRPLSAHQSTALH